MKIDYAPDIKSFLAKYRNFAEWIIQAMNLTDYGTRFDVSLSAGWVPDEAQTSNSLQGNRILLSFRLVQEIHISNALTAAMLSSPQALNWGMNEVALVRVVDSSVFWPPPFENRRFHRVEFLWEGERNIAVVFHELHFADQG